MPNIVTVLVVGDTGVGKSQNGNAFLQKDSFQTSSRPNSCTHEISAQSNIINGITRYYIDTQGLESTDSLDADYINQMVSFLKEWKYGVNAFFVVINIQQPRFDQSIQKLLKFMNSFLNNPDFWNQTGIVFTKCYKDNFNKEIAETQYRQELIDFIKKLPGCNNLNPQMPCFFVDSARFLTDEDTKFQYTRMFEFAQKNKPVPTQTLQIVKPEYKKVEDMLKKNFFVRSENVGDQIIKKYTNWNDQISFSDPIIERSNTEEIKTKVD